MAGKIPKTVERKIDRGEVYQDTYTLRAVGGGYSTSVPKRIVERKARELKVSVEDFIKNYEVVMMYNEFDDIDGAFKFQKKEK